jgi:hypothetical protein
VLGSGRRVIRSMGDRRFFFRFTGGQGKRRLVTHPFVSINRCFAVSSSIHGLITAMNSLPASPRRPGGHVRHDDDGPSGGSIGKGEHIFSCRF